MDLDCLKKAVTDALDGTTLRLDDARPRRTRAVLSALCDAGALLQRTNPNLYVCATGKPRGANWKGFLWDATWLSYPDRDPEKFSLAVLMAAEVEWGNWGTYAMTSTNSESRMPRSASWSSVAGPITAGFARTCSAASKQMRDPPLRFATC